MRFLDKFPWIFLVVFSLTLGLAPFTPEPHLWEKLKMLVAGELTKGIDWLDLGLHGAPWVLMLLKLFRESAKVRR